MNGAAQQHGARRPEPHSSPETMGTRCHMCPNLSCIEREKARLHKWHYYCNKAHKHMEQRDLYAVTIAMCPERRPLNRGGGR